MKLEDNFEGSCKGIDLCKNKNKIIRRVEHKRLPLLYYKMNMDKNPFSLDFGYLWVEGKKIHEKRQGKYVLEDSNERYSRN